MSTMQSLRNHYPDRAEDVPVADLVGPLRSLARTSDRLLAASEHLQDEVLEGALERLDRTVCRFTTKTYTLARVMKRRMQQQADPDTPRTRVPAIMKTMMAPGEGMALIEEATAARKAGSQAWERFCERRRREISAAAG